MAKGTLFHKFFVLGADCGEASTKEPSEMIAATATKIATRARRAFIRIGCLFHTIAKSADSSSLRRTNGAGKATRCGSGSTGIMPADEPSDEIVSPRSQNVCARLSSLQHDFAGYRLQSVRRIFPNVAADSGHRDKSARKPDRPAEHDYGFHALSAARQPPNRFRIPDQARAASLEVGLRGLGGNASRRFAGDETNHGRRAHDLWRR